MNDKSSQTSCCVVGGGPAGVMLGYLLARQGVPVTVLEKHADFFRDFRGDTVHPSTLELFYQLGLLDRFLKRPHQELTSVGGVFGDFAFRAADCSRLPTHCRFIALMPQWEFLNFLSEEAKKYSTFDLRMEHEAVDLLREDGRVRGVVVRTRNGTEQIRADLVVGCDGRHSVMRRVAQLPMVETGVPIDVLWFRISRREGDPEQVFGNINYGRVLILINRGDYFESALLIKKNSFEEVKQQGIETFRQTLAKIAPFLEDRVHEVRDWEQVKPLSVQINRLTRWYRPGLLCIGDAAHAMSPVFGVGINLAIQDAVATANLLAEPLRNGEKVDHLLSRVQRRREIQTRLTQFAQRMAHKGFQSVFCRKEQVRAPWQLKAVIRLPGLQHAMARFVGVGIWPERVAGTASPDRRKTAAIPKLVALAAGVAAGMTVLRRGFAKQRS